MANNFLTVDMITNESLAVMENNLVFAKNINRRFDNDFGNEELQIGDTIRIRKPPRYIGRTGAALAVEDSTESSVTLTLDTQFGVDMNYTTKDLTLKMAMFAERFIKPAMATIANKIDYDGLALYNTVPNQVGTPGTSPNASSFILGAGQYMDDAAAPRDGMRGLVLNPAANASMIAALQGLFNSSDKVSAQYKKGLLAADTLGFDIAMDQNVHVHTIGTATGTPLTNGAGQTGSSLVTDGWTASTTVLKKGDIITLGTLSASSVNGVNPQSRQSTGRLRQFVVTADVTSDGSGNATIPIYPAITTSGAFQTVTAAPGDGVAINVYGTAANQYPINLAYHKDAFTLGMAQLYMPDGVDMASRKTYNGFSIRLVRAYDINNDKLPTRSDVLYGFKELYSDWACRIIG